MIREATFVKSSSKLEECPKTGLPEYVFLGRSNVGKSSLINMLVERNKLSKTSSKPGKTQLINHFIVNQKLFFVDLPGYGWAKTSKKNRESWDNMTKDYLLNSDKIALIFILIDIRLKPQEIDINYINYLGKNKLPVNLIFTKADKIKKSEIDKRIDEFTASLSQYWSSIPNYFISSSLKKTGRKEIIKYIFEINENLVA
ncbi:MAG: ribosome biogenesis GTP-binding protein YihA/YsxC [Cytophagales bacterium]|tara:strand:- start:80 stop:679 length:600 start_codon:yes stop_codon:yes gene_type:complete